jgi:hypothetical protein
MHKFSILPYGYNLDNNNAIGYNDGYMDVLLFWDLISFMNIFTRLGARAKNSTILI